MPTFVLISCFFAENSIIKELKVGIQYLACRGLRTKGLEIMTRPNIVLIMADNQPADLLGCYGNDEVKTPHLDALASDALPRAVRVTGVWLQTNRVATGELASTSL